MRHKVNNLESSVVVQELEFAINRALHGLFKPLNLIGRHGNGTVKFSKQINSSEAIWGIKLKVGRIVLNISLFKNFFIAIVEVLWLPWQLKFP